MPETYGFEVKPGPIGLSVWETSPSGARSAIAHHAQLPFGALLCWTPAGFELNSPQVIGR
jgi:hypothetical protein